MSKDYFPQENRSIERAGLKIYLHVIFQWLHAFHMWSYYFHNEAHSGNETLSTFKAEAVRGSTLLRHIILRFVYGVPLLSSLIGGEKS